MSSSFPIIEVCSLRYLNALPCSYCTLRGERSPPPKNEGSFIGPTPHCSVRDTYTRTFARVKRCREQPVTAEIPGITRKESHADNQNLLPAPPFGLLRADFCSRQSSVLFRPGLGRKEIKRTAVRAASLFSKVPCSDRWLWLRRAWCPQSRAGFWESDRSRSL